MPRCPVCKLLCSPLEYEGVNVSNCGGCGGYWMTHPKLSAICERRTLQMPEPVRQKFMDLADASNSTQELWCLGCGKAMRKVQFRLWNDIVLDECPKCHGIWLDRGELEKCQIYWEYLQDHPEQWQGNKAAELTLQQARLRENQGLRRKSWPPPE
jgi:Zn-finger nucleic acid-binding protein